MLGILQRGDVLLDRFTQHMLVTGDRPGYAEHGDDPAFRVAGSANAWSSRPSVQRD
jgi:hypothetical protein